MNAKNYIAGVIIILYLGLLGYLYLGIGQGKTYPNKPITIIVHSKPGSAVDYMARRVADIARNYSEVAFVVENRSGTQGLVAMQHVLDMKADGYTLLGVTKSFLSTVMVNKSKVSLDDFQFVANMVSDPEALISNKERRLANLNDIIQDAKGGEIQIWIGPGTGSRDHLMALKTWEKLGINAQWIDYKSAPQSILAMLRDESAIYVGNPSDIKGKSDLDVVSIASEKRLASLPDVPTFKEQGYDLDESMWRGFAFKKGVPEEAVKYVTKVLQDVVNDKEWESFCNETYVFSNFEKQEEFTKRIATETEDTNIYLDKAGLLVTYIISSSVHLAFVMIIIAAAVFLLLLGLNKFKLKKFNFDQIIAGCVISVSLFFYYQTMLFQIPDTVNITSPSLIPKIWIIVLVFLGVLLFFQSKNKQSFKEAYSPKVVLIIIAYLIAYLIAMQWAGYYLTTPVFIIATMYLLNYRKTIVMLINAFGFVLFSFFVFSELLHIELPLGWWFI